MAGKKIVTLDELRAELSYDENTGIFRWKLRRRGVKVGAEAGTTDQNGYRYVNIRGVFYLAHRLAWFYVNGEWPSMRLSFRDGSPLNCTIGNIYECDGADYGFRGRPSLTDDERKQRAKATYRRHDLKRDFGITVAEYDAMLAAQNGCCAICGCEETATRNGNVKMLAVDHCHKTDVIRELLCQRCNVLIGHCDDDPAVLRAAAAYIERHAAERDAA